MAGPSNHRIVVIVVAVSTPLALALETTLRKLLFPPEFEELRQWWGPTLTPWMWVVVGLTLGCSLLGVRMQRWLVRRALSKRPQQECSAADVRKVETEALFFSTSAPQVPALLATVGFMLGASIVPVAISVAAATLGVVVIGVRTRASDTTEVE